MFREWVAEQKKAKRGGKDLKEKVKKKRITGSDFLLELTDASFNSAIMSDGKPVMIAFFTPWSAPSKQMKDLLLRMAETFKEKAVIALAPLDQVPEASRSCYVDASPTTIVFYQGQETWRHVGANISIVILCREVAQAHTRDRLAAPEPPREWISLDEGDPEPNLYADDEDGPGSEGAPAPVPARPAKRVAKDNAEPVLGADGNPVVKRRPGRPKKVKPEQAVESKSEEPSIKLDGYDLPLLPEKIEVQAS